MAQVRLLSMTLVLTALIWASADRLVNESAVLDVTVAPVAAQSDAPMLLSTEAARDSITVTVSGPRRAIDAVRNRKGLRARLPIPDQPTGEAIVGIGEEYMRRELAERFNEFARLRVLRVQPSEIRVFVDHMVSRQLELTANSLALDYDVEPQLQPTTIQVRLRESRAADLPDDRPLSLEIGPDIERVLKEKPFGRVQTVSVLLDPSVFGPDAEFSPRSVEASATVRAERVVRQVPTVPVLVAMSFGNLARDVQAVSRDRTPLSLVTQTITVAGMPDAVARLISGEARAYGIIQLKEEDLETLGVVKLVTPEYHLPKDVELAANPPPIEMMLIRVQPGDGEE